MEPARPEGCAARLIRKPVDGVDKGNVYPNSSIRVTRLSAGVHEVGLPPVPANCRVDGSNPRAVNVARGQVIPVSFAMSCVAATGSIEITALTTGIDPDLTGYTVRVDEEPTQALSLNGTVTIERVPPGDHLVHLGGLSMNCASDPGEDGPTRSKPSG